VKNSYANELDFLRVCYPAQIYIITGEIKDYSLQWREHKVFIYAIHKLHMITTEQS